MTKTKLISLLVCLALMINIFGTFAVSAENSLDEKVYHNAANALVSFGILDEYDGVVDTTKITRYGFVSLMVKLYESAGIRLEDKGNYFMDITPNTSVSSTVAKAYSAGLIHGDGSANFRPNDIITLNEAVTIMLNALGYNKVKDSLTAHHSYISIANELDLHDDIYAADGTMSYSDTYTLIYNMLNTEMLQIYSVGSWGNSEAIQYNTVDGETFLYTMFNIKAMEGVMIANEMMHITDDEQLPSLEYKILSDFDEQILFVSESGADYSKYIGMNVKTYYRDIKSKNRVVYMCEVFGDNKYLDIDGDNVIKYDYNSRKLEYYKESDIDFTQKNYKETYKKIPVSVNVIYNSYYVVNNKAVFDRINDAASGVGDYNIRNIRLLDNNGDGDIDIMYVNIYRNYVVERISVAGDIMDYHSGDVINLKNDTDAVVVIKDAKGEPMDYTAIKEKDVVSVEQDINGQRVVVAHVASNTSENVIEALYTDDHAVMVNGNEISVANGVDVKAEFDNIRVGKRYVIYHDICGKAARFAFAGDDTMRFGYVLGSAKSLGLSANAKLKLCVPDTSEFGLTISAYDVADELNIDGAPRQKAADYAFSNLEYELIRFAVNNDNVITKIETPSVSRGDGKFSYFDEYEANGVLDLRFRSGAAEFHQYSTDNDRPAKLMYDTDTIFMTVPKDDSVDYADERCARLQDVTNYVETGGSYEMHGYITDGSKLKCDIILFAVSNDETDSDERWFKRQRSMVVDKVSYSLNNEGNSGVLIKGMENKKRAAYVSSGKSIIDYSTGKPITIVPGDIVQVKVNVYGDIESVRRIYNKTKDTYGDGISYTTNADYTNDARVVLGNVYSTDGPFFSIVEDSKKNHTNKGRYAEIIKTTTPYAYVYVYDNETKKVSLGTYKDIINDSRVVYVYIKEGTINDIVVYR